MGLAGRLGAKYYCEPGHADFAELVDGPRVISKNRIDVMRVRWKTGGREAVEANYREPGKRAWAWWHFTCPRRDFKMALGLFACEALALIELGYADAAEREQIADLGIVAKQILTDPPPTEAEIRAARRAERQAPTFPRKLRALRAK
jgi:hypothetical protein